jgi:hypothetical protein
MKSLADLLGYLLLSTGGFLLALDILLVLARIAGGQGELGSMMAWLTLFVGVGIPGITMLVGGILLTRKLAHQ